MLTAVNHVRAAFPHARPDIRLALRQADQARTDFAAIESDLEMLMARLARMLTRADLARTALGIIFCAAVLVILWFEAFWRHCL